MLVLRGESYGAVFCAPGARGFFGEGYPYHKLFKLLGMSWAHTGFVSKTIVYPPRVGNMPLKEDLRPRERLVPRSIVLKPLTGHVLNAVGLSGPGAEWAFASGSWQKRTDSFMISFMSVAASPDERLHETKLFVDLFASYLPQFKGGVAVQANRACPNTGHPSDDFYAETFEMLNILAVLGVPVVVNYNPTVPGAVMKATVDHEACDALWIANTVPWGDPRIDWQGIFGTNESPLAKRNLPIPGGGGLSGPACLPLTIAKVEEARQLGITKPIVAGNGIRPWRMRSIIQAANNWG
jgi:dihydroorotate dehydrogenase